MADIPAPLDPMLAFAPPSPETLASVPWPPPEWGIDAMLAGVQPLAIGPTMPPVEETAAPVPAAVPVVAPVVAPTAPQADAVPLSGMQPGMGPITQATLDRAYAEPQVPADPWAPAPGPSVDPVAVQQTLQGVDNALDPRTPQLPAEYLDADELTGALTTMGAQDPVAYAEYKVADDEQKRVAMQGRLAEEQERDAEMRRANDHFRRQALEQADAARAAVDAEGANLAADGGFWDSRSDGQKLAMFIAVVMGGLVQGRTGGPNQGLQMMERFVDQHVASSRAKLADKRSAVAAMYGRVNDDYLAEEAMRAATWKAVEAQLASEEQLYDPRGTEARKRADARVAARAQMGEAARRAFDYAEDRSYKQIKSQIETLKAQADIRKANAEATKLERQNAGGGAAPKLSREWVKQRYGYDPGRDVTEVELDREIKRDQNVKDLKKPTDAKAGEFFVGGVKRVGSDGKVTYDKARQADGSVWNPPEWSMKRLEQMGSNIGALTDALEKLKQHREKAGGSNKWTSSEDQNRADQLAMQAVFAYADMTGKSTADENSINALKVDLFGVSDPGSYRADGMIQGIEDKIGSAIKQYGDVARKANYTGDLKDIVPAAPKPAGPRVNTRWEELGAQAVGRNFSERHEATLRFGGSAPVADNAKLQGGLERIEAIKTLGNAAKVYKAEGAKAQLRSLAKNALTDEEKKLAQDLLDASEAP